MVAPAILQADPPGREPHMAMEKGMGTGESRFRDRLKKDEAHKKQLPGEDEAPLPPPVEPIKTGAKPGRNEPCSCGSGKKFKQCCGKAG
jgi:preprotein translocase subunit SecA